MSTELLSCFKNALPGRRYKLGVDTTHELIICQTVEVEDNGERILRGRVDDGASYGGWVSPTDTICAPTHRKDSFKEGLLVGQLPRESAHHKPFVAACSVLRASFFLHAL